MYADRYAPKPINRGSLTLSVAIVGGLVAAAALSPTVIDHVTHDKRIRIFDVPPPSPPPPPVQPPKIQPKSPPKATVIAPPDTIVPPIREDVFPVTPVDPGPPPDLGTLPGPVPGAAIDPPKPPAPVMVGAQPDPRVDFQPTYPAEERRAGREGVVRLRVLIGVDGRVREVEQIASPGEAFWRVTQDRALRAWRFRPATRDGVPYEVWRTMTVRFKLETD